MGATAHPPGKHLPQTADRTKETEPNTLFNKVIFIGRLGQNAEAKTAQNNREYVALKYRNQGDPSLLRSRVTILFQEL